MRKQPSIKLNFLYNISYQILLVIAPLIVAPYISRVLGDGNIGTYSYTYSMAQYFSAFCALGVALYGNRTIAVCRDDPERLSKTFSEITTLKFCIAAVVLTVYGFYVGVIADESYRLYSILQVFYILSIVLDIHWFFAGLEDFKVTVMRLLIIKVLSTACIFLFVKTESDLVLYTLIMSASFLISEVYLWLVSRTRVKWVRPRLKDAFRHLKPMLILFIPVLAIDLYRMMDKIMLGELVSMNSVGQYENAEKIIKICLSVVTALSSVMLPRMAKLNAENDTKTMKKYLGNSMKVILGLSCALAAGIFATGRLFAPIFFGEQFVECGYVLEVLSISVLLIAWSNMVRTQHLIPCNKDRIYIAAVWCGVAVNLVLNILLIPKFHAVGAAVATVLTELTVCVIQTVFVWKSLPMSLGFKNLIAYGSIGVVMCIVVRLLALAWPWSSIALLVTQVIVGAVVYLSLAAVYLWWSDRELCRSALATVKRVLKKLHLVH